MPGASAFTMCAPPVRLSCDETVSDPGADSVKWLRRSFEESRPDGDSGAVVVLDKTGASIRSGRPTGRPTCIAVATDHAGERRILLATDRGEIKAFAIRP